MYLFKLDHLVGNSNSLTGAKPRCQFKDHNFFNVVLLAWPSAKAVVVAMVCLLSTKRSIAESIRRPPPLIPDPSRSMRLEEVTASDVLGIARKKPPSLSKGVVSLASVILKKYLSSLVLPGGGSIHPLAV